MVAVSLKKKKHPTPPPPPPTHLLLLFSFFFFQAEDGIRDSSTSRGLGDVYKRQTDNRMMEQIANETGATIGGTLYSDTLSGETGPASTYLDMMRHNATTLSEALGS